MRDARKHGAAASRVSRALARGGHRPLPSGTPYTRQGLRVKRTHGALAHVVADYDRDGEARRAADGAAEILAAAGYRVTRVSDRILRIEEGT